MTLLFFEWGRWKTKATNHHGQASAWEPMESARTSIGSLGEMRFSPSLAPFIDV